MAKNGKSLIISGLWISYPTPVVPTHCPTIIPICYAKLLTDQADILVVVLFGTVIAAVIRLLLTTFFAKILILGVTLGSKRFVRRMCVWRMLTP